MDNKCVGNADGSTNIASYVAWKAMATAVEFSYARSLGKHHISMIGISYVYSYVTL